MIYCDQNEDVAANMEHAAKHLGANHSAWRDLHWNKKIGFQKNS